MKIQLPQKEKPGVGHAPSPACWHSPERSTPGGAVGEYTTDIDPETFRQKLTEATISVLAAIAVEGCLAGLIWLGLRAMMTGGAI